jgi:hypothetical protein
VLDRTVLIAQQYGIYMDGECDLYDFFYLSSAAKKQRDDKIAAAKDNMVWIA